MAVLLRKAWVKHIRRRCKKGKLCAIFYQKFEGFLETERTQNLRCIGVHRTGKRKGSHIVIEIEMKVNVSRVALLQHIV